MNIEEQIDVLNRICELYRQHRWGGFAAVEFAELILKDKDIARGLKLLEMEKAGKLVELCSGQLLGGYPERLWVKYLPEEQDNEEGTASEAPHI